MLGWRYFTWYNPHELVSHQQQSCPALNIVLKSGMIQNTFIQNTFINEHQQWNLTSMWQVLLLSVQTQSPKPYLTTLVFFCSALTPQHFPYTQLVTRNVKVKHIRIATTSTNWSCSYYPERDKSRLYTTRFLMLPMSLIFTYFLCNVKSFSPMP